MCGERLSGDWGEAALRVAACEVRELMLEPCVVCGVERKWVVCLRVCLCICVRALACG